MDQLERFFTIRPVIIKALEYYNSKLMDLLNYDETKHIEVLKEDIKNNILTNLDTIQLISSITIDHENRVTLYPLSEKINRQTINLALNKYKEDIKKSMNFIERTLLLNPTLENLNNELNTLDDAIKFYQVKDSN